MTHALINGHRATAVHAHIPIRGPWFADVAMESTPGLSGRVTIDLGEVQLVGTIDDRYAGAFGAQDRYRVVAGGGGWDRLLPKKHYHNDAGVRPITIAQDAAREAGETLGTFEPGILQVGNDYSRQVGPASQTLDAAIGEVDWWVDYAGLTQVGTRPSSAAQPGSYQLLEYDPINRLAVLALEDISRIGIGSVISTDLAAQQTVREIEIRITAESARVFAWVGESSTGGRLAGVLRTLVERVMGDRLWGKYRYRVVRMTGERVELQAVRQRAGLPDILPVTMWPGVAGAWADLTQGSEVLVEFMEGLRSGPIVTGFAPKGGSGFVPQRLTLGATGSAPNAAREGDSVRVTIPAGSFLVSADNGVANAAPVEVDGEITSGSEKVGIG